MTIQRQYSLPNCKLVLEGLSDPAAPIDPIRPLLSILVNAECHFSGYAQPIQGGREFFESLVNCVSQYAQEALSGIRRPRSKADPFGIAHGLVQLEKHHDRHLLTVQPPAGVSEAQTLDLGTVQLFDLVEAIDQFVADPQTLPDFTLALSPLPKRYVTSAEPLAQRAAPVAIGVSSLAAAAAVLFFVPVPEVRRPEPANANSSPDASQTTPAPIASSPAGSSPDAASPTLTTEATTNPGVTPSPTTGATAGATAPSDAEVTALLRSAPEITSPETVRQITRNLRDKLDRAWTGRPTFDEDLEYRVAVSANGDILGFKFVNDAAIAHVQETPLLNESYQSIDPNAPNREPIAQMRVVFTPSGAIEVSPWRGQPRP
ncbi:MAG: DUF4335 domain-containing protein [Microcoleus sp. SIO2G3]|nr:DUF4335 domain-containing protein [Microcoleus sp. SIO2G3]